MGQERILVAEVFVLTVFVVAGAPHCFVEEAEKQCQDSDRRVDCKMVAVIEEYSRDYAVQRKMSNRPRLWEISCSMPLALLSQSLVLRFAQSLTFYSCDHGEHLAQRFAAS